MSVRNAGVMEWWDGVPWPFQALYISPILPHSITPLFVPFRLWTQSKLKS